MVRSLFGNSNRKLRSTFRGSPFIPVGTNQTECCLPLTNFSVPSRFQTHATQIRPFSGFGKLTTRLPLCFRHPNRVFLSNGKHPSLWLMLAKWRNHVMVLAFRVSLKLCETSIGQHLSPRWGHVVLVNVYPVLTTFPWCGRQTDRRTDKWLPKFKFLWWIKNQILLAMRLSSRRLAHPWSSAKTYLN